MNKDKAWLVKEVDRLRLENTLSNNPMMISNRDVIAKVSRLIDQLEEPKITEEQAWNKEIDRLSDYLLRNFEKEIGGDRNYETPVDAAIRLLGEKRKPVIPQFVADWIEECKEVKHNLYGVLDFAPTDVEEWLFHTPEKSERVDLIARAWLYGYEVEKEPQWVVLRNCMYIKNFYFGEMNNDYRVGSIAYKEQAMVFTDKAKAEAVALLVDGEVEELEE